ncbi:glycerate kinase [Agrococcus jejuensis]|uniref:glycerate kinase n=1 Tax=Agrococcus jejuensis TaxID=399736 RepID=UPI0021B5CB02|nr:glycerate kinase [Agrococcus jejuensis]
MAPDKLKGTLTAAEAADAIAAGVLATHPDATVRRLPFADGGEGTVDAVIAAGAEARVDRVTGPLGDPVDARWALLGDTAVIEMAAASGLPLVSPTPATALDAHTEGTGELVRIAVAAGARRVLLGVGGSASTDGGAGALRALGVRLLDADGRSVAGGGGSLPSIASVDASSARALLAGVEVVLCSDVANPFVGERGAAHVFGPQKGADAAAVERLDEGLRRFARVVHAATDVDLETADWGGSGGGIAGGLVAVLGATAADGVELLADLLGLDDAIRAADLVIVAEGSLDEQSLMGKTPVGVARHAAALGVPCVAVAGRIVVSSDALQAVDIADAVAAVDVAPNVEAALAEPARWLQAATETVLARR